MTYIIAICPRCDGQGDILRKKIRFNDQLIYICDECEAIWFNDQNIQIENFIDYSVYMEALSKQGLWSELDDA